MHPENRLSGWYYSGVRVGLGRRQGLKPLVFDEVFGMAEAMP
jgi:hypothetical protein